MYAVADLSSSGIDQGDLVDGPLTVNYGTGNGGHLLIGGAAVGIQHTAGGKCAGIDAAHRAFGIVKDDVVP